MRQPGSYDKKKVREYIIDINNKLFELKNELYLDIPEIKKITDYELNDYIRKEIIDIIKSEEEQDKKKETIRKMALIASGVEDRKCTNYSDDDEKESIAYSHYVAEAVNRSLTNGGLTPPKTDWERIDISKDEKEKIIESIKANPNSNAFSKEFKWNPKDFLGAFTFLEESKGYNGPLIVSLISDKEGLEKYSKNILISEKINKIFLGKFVLLLAYDITASSSESKYIHLGFNYNSMNGTLEFDCAIPVEKMEIKNAQRRILMEYMDSMGVSYNQNHEDLKMI